MKEPLVMCRDKKGQNREKLQMINWMIWEWWCWYWSRKIRNILVNNHSGEVKKTNELQQFIRHYKIICFFMDYYIQKLQIQRLFWFRCIGIGNFDRCKWKVHLVSLWIDGLHKCFVRSMKCVQNSENSEVLIESESNFSTV